MYLRASLVLCLAFIGFACSSAETDSLADIGAWEPGPVPMMIDQQYKSAVEVNPDDPATDELRDACVNSCVVREIPGKTGTMATPMGEIPSYIEPHKVITDCCAVIEFNARTYHVIHHDRNVDY